MSSSASGNLTEAERLARLKRTTPPTAAEGGSDSDSAHQNGEDSNKRIKLEPGVSSSAAPTSASTSTSSTVAAAPPPPSSTTAQPTKKRRWDTQESTPIAAATAAPIAAASTPAAAAPLTAAEKAAALQKSIADRMAALKSKKLVPGAASSNVVVKQEPGLAASTTSVAQPPLHFMAPSVTVKDESKPSWQALRLDAQGRQIDEHGNLVVQSRPTELKINKAALEAKGKDQKPSKHTKIASTIYKEEGQSTFHDPRMHEVGPERKSRATLAFVKPGKYIQQAAVLRQKQLEKEISSSAAAAATSSTANTVDRVSVTIMKPAAIPSVEWWDVKMLRDTANGYPATSASYDEMIAFDRCTSYVYHPVEVDSLTSEPVVPPMKVQLTQKEASKIKRREKKEALEEKRKALKWGLINPDEPKMKIKNLMNYLLNDSVAEPSQMEAKVRLQMAQRASGHVDANAARKLTPEQKAEKKRRKYEEDLTHGVHCAVYRTGDLTDGKTRYQIDVNTKQWNLYGLGIIHPSCSLVIVEGGPKNQRRFQRLMLRRIKWKKRKRTEMEKQERADMGGMKDEEMMNDEHAQEEEEDDDSDDSDDEDDATASSDDLNLTRSRTGACVRVWSGIVPRLRFPVSKGFTFENCRSEIMARNFLAKMQMETYWDQCRSVKEETIDL